MEKWSFPTKAFFTCQSHEAPMAPRRWWVLALAALALATFLVGVVVAVAPPEPECDGQGVYCQEDAYDRLRLLILGTWLGALGLLLCAGVLHIYLLKHPPAPRQRARNGDGRVAPVTRDGRPLVTARPPAPPSPPTPQDQRRDRR